MHPVAPLWIRVTLVSAVWGKILKLERGHGSSTCNMRKDRNMSFDTTPFVKMIRGVDSSVSAKRSAEGYVKVWLCLLLAVLFIGSVRVQQSTESQQFLSNYLPRLQSSEWVTNKERCVIESWLSVWTYIIQIANRLFLWNLGNFHPNVYQSLSYFSGKKSTNEVIICSWFWPCFIICLPTLLCLLKESLSGPNNTLRWCFVQKAAINRISDHYCARSPHVVWF